MYSIPHNSGYLQNVNQKHSVAKENRKLSLSVHKLWSLDCRTFMSVVFYFPLSWCSKYIWKIIMKIEQQCLPISSNKSRKKNNLISLRWSMSQARKKPNFFVTRPPSFSDQHYPVLSNGNWENVKRLGFQHLKKDSDQSCSNRIVKLKTNTEVTVAVQ